MYTNQPLYLLIVPEAPSSSPPISVTWEPANDDDSGKILAAVLGSMLGATLISILFYIFYKKRLQVKEEGKTYLPLKVRLTLPGRTFYVWLSLMIVRFLKY